MEKRTEKDFWIEMSIREILAQTHFAELAYQNIDRKATRGIDGVFSSIHSFLSHCAMVSKMLIAADKEVPKGKFSKIINKFLIKFGIYEAPVLVGDILRISKSSTIHNRKFRNNLEHYDERLKRWIREKGINSAIGTYNIGPKSMIGIPNMIFVSHYDPSDNTFTFVNEDFDLGLMFGEVQRIKSIADNWVSSIK